ncbi:glycosyltransferase family 87 protein [Kaistia dalseonensis]|uniref:DUF2029 domain-containing protein n=1 Tax=Kaistia dalseonensis TaxID=410840 RepID=A0ABU0HBJ2_9HYPH|nr:glycosyltransferase family 87 protein [Kaistia dalseonensis]MCX5497024.1 glycosyltransferase family 87 protein [Kaistia dalseonensis]MDQ0439650.1 hypothetical protein [Kaistia dalseonensis]
MSNVNIATAGAGSRDPLDRLLPVAGVVGLALFVLFNLVVVVLVLRDPSASSVVPVYRNGALGWWRGEDIFGAGREGFLYLPSFAVLYTPFALLGPNVGDALWRVVSVVLLAFALWRASILAMPSMPARDRLLVFGAALLFLMPSAFSALRNGQATTILTALMLLSALSIAERRWWLAALLLGLAFAIKPLAFVMMLLVGVLYPKLGWRLLVVTIGVLLLPLVNPDPVVAFHLYGLGIQKIMVAGDPGEGAWADITGLLHSLGIWLSDPVLTAIRIVIAAVVLGLAYITKRRRDGLDAAIDIFALSVVYLMLMNPRTEANTYIMFGSVLAVYASIVWNRDRLAGPTWFLGAIAFGFLVQALTFKLTNLWLQPLLCLAFLPFLVWRCLAAPQAATTSARTR